MKKFARLSLFAMAAILAVTLSSFINEPASSTADNSTDKERAYQAICPSGKIITVCGENGSGCTPLGEC